MWLWLACSDGSGLGFGPGVDVPSPAVPPDGTNETDGPATTGSPPLPPTETTTPPTEPTDPTEPPTDPTEPIDPPDPTDTGLSYGPPIPGTYIGPIDIAYEMTVPLLGGSSTCSGTMTVVYDPAAPDPILGTFSCDWPVLDLWAAVFLDEMNGELRGDGPLPAVDGWLTGVDGSGTFEIDDPWAGAIADDRMIGTFSGGSFLVDDYSGTWDLSWVF